MPSKVNPISEGSWGRYYTIHKPMAPASESLLITFQIQSTGNKQQQHQLKKKKKKSWCKGDCFCTLWRGWHWLTLFLTLHLKCYASFCRIRTRVDWNSPDECLKRWGNGDGKCLGMERARYEKGKKRHDRCLRSANLELEQWKAGERWIER